MVYASDTILSVSEFTQWVKCVQDSFVRKTGVLQEPWFRGVGSSSFHLVPGLYRKAQGHAADVAERSIRRAFERRAPLFMGDRQERDTWDFYFLMQHYRTPTRLLDWTDSAMVALYFAVYATNPHEDDLPVVWALNPFELNRIAVGRVAVLESTWSLAKPYLRTDTRIVQPVGRELPAAISPRLADQRMLAQHSQFTIHGSNPKGIDEIKKLHSLGAKGFLRRAIIKPTNGFEHLKVDMATCGIVHTLVFPDLEGLSLDLQRDYL